MSLPINDGCSPPLEWIEEKDPNQKAISSPRESTIINDGKSYKAYIVFLYINNIRATIIRIFNNIEAANTFVEECKSYSDPVHGDTSYFVKEMDVHS